MNRATARPRQTYLPGLDGIRALAVLAVMLFHSAVDVTPGGFLGVEVFFVISGFIITCGLLREREGHGSIDLGMFWKRRALRLLPALALLLLVVLGYAEWLKPEVVAELRGDALAAMGYVTNWYYVAGGQSYFDSFAAP